MTPETILKVSSGWIATKGDFGGISAFSSEKVLEQLFSGDTGHGGAVVF